MFALALSLQLLAATAAPDSTPAGTPTPVALGAPNFVQITSLVGVPADTTIRAAFLTAFRGTFALDELGGERRTPGGEWRAGLALPNRFHLLEGDLSDDTWKIDVSIGAPPPMMSRRRSGSDPQATVTRVDPRRRTSRGMVVALTVRVPDPRGGILRTTTSSAAFYFPVVVDPGTSLGVPAARYVFPWLDAGRIAASLVLETLHRESGDLVDAERMDIHPAERSTTGR